MPLEAEIMVLTPVSTFIYCEGMSQLLNLSEPHMFHLGRGNNHT